jgi:hypothetical protein
VANLVRQSLKCYDKIKFAFLSDDQVISKDYREQNNFSHHASFPECSVAFKLEGHANWPARLQVELYNVNNGNVNI